MKQTRISDERRRHFRTLYKGRYRVIVHRVWYLNNGSEKHVMAMTDQAGIIVMKRWEWLTDNGNANSGKSG